MSEDESGTLKRLKSLRRGIVQPKITECNGRVVKLMGDGLLAEFPSVVDAVQCAVDIQQSTTAQEADLDSDHRIRLRIGINLGDVIVEGSDIYGDGVNIAARLEGLADPGGICLSGKVYEEIRNKLSVAFEDLGEKQVKNIPGPLRVYRWTGVVASSKAAKPETQSVPPHTDKPTIAVLPFDNMSGDPEQEYFSDGISEDIITELSRFHELFVIARNSSFVFKKQSVDVTEIGKQLGVKYIVEGSVRKSGQRVRITAQLIDSASRNHLWADRYDREIEHIFEVQDEVARTITSTLVGRVEHAHGDSLKRKSTSNLVAYDWFVRGREKFYNGTKESNQDATRMFKQAISLDSNYAAAYALLAEACMRDWITFWSEPPEDSFKRAWTYANKAVVLDDTDSRTHTALGVASLFSGDLELARVHLEKALRLNSSDTRTYVYLSRYHAFSGEPERAIDLVNEALSYNPFGKYDFSLVPAYYLSHRYDDTIEVMSRIQNPAPAMLWWLASAYAQIGDIKTANDTITKFVTTTEKLFESAGLPTPENWMEFILLRNPMKRSEDMEHLKEGLRKAGVSG